MSARARWLLVVVVATTAVSGLILAAFDRPTPKASTEFVLVVGEEVLRTEATRRISLLEGDVQNRTALPGLERRSTPVVERVTDDGKAELRLHFSGAASETGPCGRRYSAGAVESAAAVVVYIVESAPENVDELAPCPPRRLAWSGFI